MLWELGAEVIKIGVEPDGLNINEECGTTAPEALCAKVREMRADIGIALDGDADRVVIVDEKGQHRRRRPDHGGDRRELAPHGKLAAGGVVATVMSNLGLERYLDGLGLKLERTPGRRPLRGRAHAQARLQRGRRAVGPHRAVRLHDHRRRAGRGPAGAGRRGGHRPAGERGVQAASRPCRSFMQNVRYANGAPLEHAMVKSAIDTGQGAPRRERPAAGAPLRHRAGDPGHGRGRRRGLVRQVVGDIADAVRSAAQARRVASAVALRQSADTPSVRLPMLLPTAGLDFAAVRHHRKPLMSLPATAGRFCLQMRKLPGSDPSPLAYDETRSIRIRGEGSDPVSGGVPEWLKGTDCKSVGFAYVGSNPTPSTKFKGSGFRD